MIHVISLLDQTQKVQSLIKILLNFSFNEEPFIVQQLAINQDVKTYNNKSNTTKHHKHEKALVQKEKEKEKIKINKKKRNEIKIQEFFTSKKLFIPENNEKKKITIKQLKFSIKKLNPKIKTSNMNKSNLINIVFQYIK